MVPAKASIKNNMVNSVIHVQAGMTFYFRRELLRSAHQVVFDSFLTGQRQVAIRPIQRTADSRR